MAAAGRKRTTQVHSTAAPVSLARERYSPPAPYKLDIQVMSTQEMRKRLGARRVPAPHRVDFYVLLIVTAGRCEHWVDFSSHACKAGSWIVARPGQVLRFAASSNWHGWIVMFQSKFLLPTLNAGSDGARGVDIEAASILAGLPNCLQLDAAEQRTCLAGIEQIRDDCTHVGTDAQDQALLRHQLTTVLLRLRAANSGQERQSSASPRHRTCFRRFRDAVEKNFADWQRVRDYAQRLGYSEKTLSRASLELTGTTAKTYLSQRIALEAQRLLAHTSMSVSEVASHLGMHEATNFVKFFKRLVGCTPTEFRRRHRFSSPIPEATGRVTSTR